MAKMSVKKSTAPRFHIDVKNDPLYLEGYQNGLVIGTTKIVEKLLLESGFSAEFIAAITGETKDFVLSIQSRLIQKGKLLPRFEAFSA